MIIRPVQASDAAALLAIYSPYVENTVITFEYIPPSLSEFSERIAKISDKFPYLVAEEEGQILGYAYASTYYGRAAYDWTAELSVYVAKEARGKKIGSKLYDALEYQLQEQGIRNLLVCISLPNEASLAMHLKRGYKQVAHFEKIGYKFDKWHDTVWLQKQIGGKSID